MQILLIVCGKKYAELTLSTQGNQLLRGVSALQLVLLLVLNVVMRCASALMSARAVLAHCAASACADV